MDGDPAQGVLCRTYTHARRYPLVIGVIGQMRLWTPISPTQLGVGVGALVVLLETHRVWGRFGLFGNTIVLLGVPWALSWAVRHLRVEGRSPLRSLVGVLTYLTAPAGGSLHGRPHRPPPPRRLVGGRVFVSERQ